MGVTEMTSTPPLHHNASSLSGDAIRRELTPSDSLASTQFVQKQQTAMI